jgi:hypothetical protein
VKGARKVGRPSREIGSNGSEDRGQAPVGRTGARGSGRALGIAASRLAPPEADPNAIHNAHGLDQAVTDQAELRPLHPVRKIEIQVIAGLVDAHRIPVAGPPTAAAAILPLFQPEHDEGAAWIAWCAAAWVTDLTALEGAAHLIGCCLGTESEEEQASRIG